MTQNASRRRARWKVPLVLVTALVAAMVLPLVIVGTSAPRMQPPPPPDRALVVPLPDGTDATLGALIDGTVPAPAEPTRTMEIQRRDGSTFEFEVRLPPTNDLYSVGVHHAWNRNYELAIECLTRIPRNHPQWARAQRFLGLRVYARMGDASRGVAHANAALAADPLEGNAWQDAIRVYLQSMGVDTQ